MNYFIILLLALGKTFTVASVFLNKWCSGTALAVSFHPDFPYVISVSNRSALEEKFCIGRKFKKISKSMKNIPKPSENIVSFKTFRFYT